MTENTYSKGNCTLKPGHKEPETTVKEGESPSWYRRYWNKVLPATAGTYTFETTYNGITCSKTFSVNCGLTGTASAPDPSEFQLYPNPATNMLNIHAQGISDGSYKLTLRNTLGQVMLSESLDIENNGVLKSFSTTDFSPGIYFFTVETDKGKATGKVIRQ